MEFAASMGRSDQGFTYWTVSLPAIAHKNTPLRNAMIATGLVSISLRRKDNPTQWAAIESRALQYANQCIGELVNTRNPPESVIACSTVFWIFEMLIGNWSNSVKHLASGNRIAKLTKPGEMSDPMVARYVQSVVADFPTSIHPEAIVKMSHQDQRSQSLARHQHAYSIIRDAVGRLESLQQRLDWTWSPHKDRAIQVVSRTTRELQKLCQKWPISTQANYNPDVVQRIISEHSPFISIINNAHSFFEDDDIDHINTFERQFRPCIDQFMWLAACLHLPDRQKIIDVWNVHRAPLPLTKRLLDQT